MSQAPKLHKHDGGNDICSWIEELTDYTPQEIQKSLEDRDLNQNAVRNLQMRTYSLFVKIPD